MALSEAKRKERDQRSLPWPTDITTQLCKRKKKSREIDRKGEEGEVKLLLGAHLVSLSSRRTVKST